MKRTIGIRKEDKNIWERRTPITPEDVGKLVKQHNLEVIVESSPIRVFPDKAYEKKGAKITSSLEGCEVIFGVKEIPPEKILPNKVYVYFSHVIKGQTYNMPMLKKLMDLKCTLLDYERITDEEGNRIVFFGIQAGQAGFIDGMWALGRRLDWEDIPNPFSRIRPAHAYLNLQECQEDFQKVGKIIEEKGLPDSLCPLVVGITGHGHVARGVQSLLNDLPTIPIPPQDLPRLNPAEVSKHHIYKVIFGKADRYAPKDPAKPFDLKAFQRQPENFRSILPDYLPFMTVLFNGIYWDERFPRLIKKEDIKKLWQQGKPKLRILGDITCDVGGSIEVNVRVTSPGNPVYVWDVEDEKTYDGVAGKGPVVLAVDNLPCEIPNEASTFFSEVLFDFIPEILNCNWDDPFDKLRLSSPLRKAVILHQGKLTPDYQYLQKYIK